jgi:hypothetical protein
MNSKRVQHTNDVYMELASKFRKGLFLYMISKMLYRILNAEYQK